MLSIYPSSQCLVFDTKEENAHFGNIYNKMWLWMKGISTFTSFLKTQKLKLRNEHICIVWENVTIPWMAHFF